MNSTTRNSLLFFIVLGAVLRIYQLAFQCPWLEEEYTMMMVNLDWSSILYTSVFVDYNPPAYYILAKISFLILPEWWAIRIPSLIAGTLLVPAMYLLGREYKSESTGVWCAGIASILFPLVYYSQYGRAYALLHLFFTLFLMFYIKEARSGNSGPAMWVFGALCIWTHLYSAIPVLLLAGSTFRFDKQWFVGGALFSAATIPLLIAMFFSAVRTRSIGVGYGDSPLVLLLVSPGEIFGVLFIILGIFLIIGLYASEIEEIQSVKMVMFGVSGITILLAFILSTITPVFPRYYAATAGLIFLLFACSGITTASEFVEGLIDTRRASPRIPWAAMVVFAIMVLLAAQFGDFSVYYTAQKYICTTIPLLST